MQHSALRDALWSALHAALFALAVVVLFLPQTRTPGLRAVFITVFTADSLLLCMRDWRNGALRQSPAAFYQAPREGRRRAKRLPFELVATLTGSAAAFVLLAM